MYDLILTIIMVIYFLQPAKYYIRCFRIELIYNILTKKVNISLRKEKSKLKEDLELANQNQN